MAVICVYVWLPSEYFIKATIHSSSSCEPVKHMGVFTELLHLRWIGRLGVNVINKYTLAVCSTLEIYMMQVPYNITERS